ncbi:MAG: glycosyl hydrolase [Brevundimonas sp. 12-68-7]|uniref:Glycosyl hydrolase n=1 Tax=Brevundimonas subvibrioides TaxID=74313 RepID=A0A258FJ27_9CAUL|nr:MAG: glycosyl hydrolase [Brevundimonas sp. 12-68-7]OYX32217.1 MAG: glycosyl hydrolase [Brevundimonas subvibrioides]
MRMRRLAALAAPLVMLAVSACATARGPQEFAARAWVTSGDRSQMLGEQTPLPFTTEGSPDRPVIAVDVTQRFQRMVGFGAAITDASAWLIQTRMSATQRDALMRELFGRDNEALGFSFARVTIGASDFSLDHYSLADVADPSLRSFSTRRMEEFVFPTVRQALAVNPDLAIMATPWSAPGWMKTTGSMIQGELKLEFYATYADYLRRYILAAAAHGVPTDYLSIQNEPDFEPDSYPGMRWGPDGRAMFIGDDLGPLLRAEGIETKILDWDHNWDQPEQPLTVLSDPDARAFVAGVAWHCYAGDVAAQIRVHEAHPDVAVFFTECSGGEWASDFSDSFSWMMKNLIIGSTNGWARGVLMWNLALDETHGPHAGGCGDCRGVVTIDSRTGAVRRNQEYYAFGHASRFVLPGAERVGLTLPDGLRGVAFRNPDGERVLIVLNEDSAPVSFRIQDGRWQTAADLPPKSAATYVWRSQSGDVSDYAIPPARPT